MRKLILAAAMLLASTAHASLFDDCDHSASRVAALSSSGVTRVVIIGRAGYLHIDGRAGATEIRATGTACASDNDALADTTLTATRSGSEVRVEAHVPEWHGGFFGGSSPRLDFSVALPEGMPIVVDDTSGELTISRVGNTDVDDTSGGIEIRHVNGDLTVRDTSGSIVIEEVTGNVHIPHDSSGSIDIHHVGGSVTIDRDGSGSIDVVDVGGDFTVGSKGSGSIDYDRVRGKVSVPMRHNRHRGEP